MVTHFWDIYRDGANGKLVADVGRFQFLKGLLSGKAKPVKIALSLYADSPGSPQHLNLQLQADILRKTFGLEIDLQPCHPDDYAVLQQTVGQMALPVIGDCHIISIDEIWLEQLIKENLIVGFLHGEKADTTTMDGNGKDEKSKAPHWDTGEVRYVSVAQDLALEMHPPSDKLRYHFGIPDRHNLGVLCYYDVLHDALRSDARKANVILPTKRKKIVPKLLAMAVRERSWLNPECKPSIAAKQHSAR